MKLIKLDALEEMEGMKLSESPQLIAGSTPIFFSLYNTLAVNMI